MTASLSSPVSTLRTLPQQAVAPSLMGASEIAALFPGPACVVSESGNVLAESPAGEVFSAAIAKEAAGGAIGPMLRLVKQTAMFNRPMGTRLSLAREDDPAAGPRSFDLALLPCRREGDEERHVLLAAFETTLEHNLRKALIASRDLFRELVRCSADFAWETDSTGVFAFVGGRGAIGYAADALHGRPAASLIDTAHQPAQHSAEFSSPFTTTAPVEDVEVRLHGAGGTSHIFLISAVPMRDSAGVWLGARGVGRDITTLRLQEEALSRARAREEVSRAIVDAMLSERSFNDMLSAAARALALTTKSDRAWVLCAGDEGRYDVGAAFGTLPHGTRHFLPPELALPVLTAQGLVAFEAAGWHYVGAPTVLRGAVNGGICVARAPGAAGFEEEIRALVGLVARHTAVAIAQAGQLRTLVDLALSDELTGLANRRAFQERYERWIKTATGPATCAAILFIDLDDFKAINDRAGHGAGDALLRTFANLLTRDSRKRDLAIRLGGDEFAVFMENIPPEHVAVRVERLLRAVSDVPLPVQTGGGNLKLSIGVATVKASDKETADAVLARADKALYAAKREGKGRICFADLPAGSGEQPSC
jgi:diguanylate cyclase (GGDEF)-like protein/PAS domain S-box-containing protein